MEITLESLGLTKKALQDRIIELAVERLLTGVTYDEDGNIDFIDSKYHEKMKNLIKDRINETITIFAEKHVLPKVNEYIENIALQQTNQWGEKKGTSVTFIEYLIQRANEYMVEEVNSDGRSKDECKNRNDSFYSTKQTRVAFMIDKYLYITIQNAMQEALKNANTSIVNGIEATVKLQLEEISKSMKCALSIKK